MSKIFDNSYVGQNPSDAVAVIGMSGRFPGAANIEEFWENLKYGVESISLLSEEDLTASGIDAARLTDENYVRAGSIIDDVDLFDAAFFGYNPREAQAMDPQQRLFVECAWQALEDAGYDPERYHGLIGVYGGCAMSTYLQRVQGDPNLTSAVGPLQVLIGNEKDYLTSQVSYKLNLHGPSVVVQSSCATSLFAVAVATHSLIDRQCDIALAGGVCIRVPQRRGYLYEPGGIFSPDGRCRVFDAEAQGVVFGNGVGIVALRRLSDALEAGDSVRAVIRGTAINNDGSAKVSFAAPSLDAQADVVRTALAAAGVPARSISYVEAHGTGTAVGDPIEVGALSQAFRATTSDRQFCALGSVKTNIGHLDHAAGIAGLIKTVLAMQHRQLPASLHFVAPNPRIDFQTSPFFVNRELAAWETDRLPRRAGVSAFSIGGNNVHVVLEEAPAPERQSRAERPSHLILLSARTPSALQMMGRNLSHHLESHPEIDMADVAYTLQVGRKRFRHRQAAVCASLEDVLTAFNGKRGKSAARTSDHRSAVFVFSGQGTQYVDMARGFYDQIAVFRETFDLCAQLLQPSLEVDLREIVFPLELKKDEASRRLEETSITQPALFAIEYALATTFMDLGVTPTAMIGHSIGEYVAACIAGVFSLRTALLVVATRGRLMQKAPRGAMLALPLSLEATEPLIGSTVDVAALNGPSLCIVAGEISEIDRLAKRLDAQGISARRLPTSHAFHSRMMEPVVTPFVDFLQAQSLNPPQVPFVSNLTGNWIEPAQATNPNYWGRHVRAAVKFEAGIWHLSEAHPEAIFLELGPGRSLAAIRSPASERQAPFIVSSLRRPQETVSDYDFFLEALGNLWISGIDINFERHVGSEDRRRVHLPTYPFERQRYWIGPPERSSRPWTTAKLTKNPDIAQWFYASAWSEAELPGARAPSVSEQPDAALCIFDDGSELCARLTESLRTAGRRVVLVKVGSRFSELAPEIFEVNPTDPNDYQLLFRQIFGSGPLKQLVHCWNIGVRDQADPPVIEHHELQFRGFFSLIFIAQALDTLNVTSAVDMAVLSTNLQAVSGEDGIAPARTTLLAACKAIPQEYPNITMRSVDITEASAEIADGETISRLCEEIAAHDRDPEIAYRYGKRWAKSFRRVQLDTGSPEATIRRQGTYLFTGGLGRISLALADALSRVRPVNLVLVGRSPFPSQERWDDALLAEGEQSLLGKRIKQLQQITQRGSRVTYVTADVAELDEMRAAVRGAIAHFGGVNGVVHSAGTLSPDAFGGISKTDMPLFEKHFRPKIVGTLVMDQVLTGLDLDFCLLVSSLSSVLAGVGFAAYSAANTFLDSFALHKNRSGSVRWIAIDWDNWVDEETSMLDRGSEAGRLAMSAEEGAQTFLRVLCQRALSHVAVSTSDLNVRLDQWINRSVGIDDGLDSSAALYSRPDLSTELVPPRDDVEKTIAGIWQELIGIGDIGVHDNFFELGGHSILVAQVAARVRAAFATQVPVQALFDNPTIEGLAKLVSAGVGQAAATRPAYDDGKQPSLASRQEPEMRAKNVLADATADHAAE